MAKDPTSKDKQARHCEQTKSFGTSFSNFLLFFVINPTFFSKGCLLKKNYTAEIKQATTKGIKNAISSSPPQETASFLELLFFLQKIGEIFVLVFFTVLFFQPK